MHIYIWNILKKIKNLITQNLVIDLQCNLQKSYAYTGLRLVKKKNYKTWKNYLFCNLVYLNLI